uniref:Glycine--tRNA ligase n=1 Tax=Panagrellus redivivus TaxID=6233 RepID=A0A7E4UQ93_PANRE
MERRIFVTDCGPSFIAVYDNLFQGLLHIVVRHHRQLEKAIPALEKVLKRLPRALQNQLANATVAAPNNRNVALRAIETFLADNKATVEQKTLREAQELVADYFDQVITYANFVKKNTTSGGKIEQRFNVDLDGVPTTLVLGTSKDAFFPKIVTAYFLTPRKQMWKPRCTMTKATI